MADDKRGNGGRPPSITFSYIKSNHFRVIRADGAIGGITPNGQIHLALYSERMAIPREVTHEINSKGGLGDEIPEERVSRSGVVREMEVDLFLDLDAADRIRIWLQDRIDEVKKASSKS